MKYLVAMGALALLSVPAAMGAALVSTNDLTSQLPAEAQMFTAAFGSYYLADDGSIWQETNGISGLQQQGGHHEDGTPFAADTMAFAVPAPPL